MRSSEQQSKDIGSFKGEIWRQHPIHKRCWGSSIGRIMVGVYWDASGNKRNEYVKEQTYNKDGYLKVKMFGKTILSHRFILECFKDNPLSKPVVNHINGVKDDNRIENLEWSTLSENRQHAYNTGLQLGPIGQKNGSSKLTNACVERIKYGHQGMSLDDIAAIYNISKSNVCLIKSGKRWKHI